MTRAKKSILISIILGIFSFLLLVGILQSTRLHHYLASKAEAIFGIQLKFEETHLNLFLGKIYAKNIEFEKPGKIHVTIPQLKLQLSPLSFITGRLIFSDVSVDHPQIEILSVKKTEFIWDPEKINIVLNKIYRSSLLSKINIYNFNIKNVLFKDQSPKEYNISSIFFKNNTTLLGAVEFELNAEDITGTRNGFERVHLAGKLGTSSLKIEQFLLKNSKMSINAQVSLEGTAKKGKIKIISLMDFPNVLQDLLMANLEANFKDNIGEIKKVEGHLAEAFLNGAGKLSLRDLSYDIPFKAENLPLSAIFSKVKSPVLQPAHGTAVVDGKAEGKLPQLKASAKATIENLEHNNVIFSKKTSGTIDFEWPELSFDAKVFPGSDGREQGNCQGDFFFKKIENGKIQTTVKKLDLHLADGSLLDIFAKMKIKGRIDGDLHLHPGPENTVEGLAKAHISNAEWFFGPMEYLNGDIIFKPGGNLLIHNVEWKIPTVDKVFWRGDTLIETDGTTVRFHGAPTEGINFHGNYVKNTGPLKMEDLTVKKDGSNLQASWVVPKNGSDSGKIKGLLNAAWLTYLPGYLRDANGQLKLDLNISGTTEKPNIQGEVGFQNTDLAFRGIANSFNQLNGKMKINTDKIDINLSGQLGDGHFVLGGTARYQNRNLDDFDLKLQGRNLSLSQSNVFHFDFDADVTLKGSLPNPILSGNMDVIEGRYVKKFVLKDFILKPFEEDVNRDTLSEGLQGVRLDLHVRNSGDMRVKNNIASLYLQSNLRIQGTLGKPQVEGALIAREGDFTLLGTDFVLTEGRLEYIDPSRREPYLTLRAESQDRNNNNFIDEARYTIVVEIKGFLSNLEVLLSSNPSLPREDILSLIAFGATQQQIRDNSKLRRSLGTSVLAGELTGLLEKPVAKTTGLDIFRLEASENGNLSRLSVGKNVTDRLSLEFLNDLDPQTAERQVQANYQVTDNILLKGQRSWSSNDITKYQLNISFRFRLN